MTDSLPPIGDIATATIGMPPSFTGLTTSANIDKTSQDFEAMFATQMLQPMFETVQVDQSFGGGNGEQVMRSFLLQEYGKILAKTGKFGIASQVKKEMLRAQEAAKRGTPADARAAQSAYVTATANGASHAAN